ncbi:MAG: hypothetical protein JRE10_10300 [Deltaproteobacteria bacterium]|nr:hypothetical protein [Deltaproteobacteria bacterium]
MNTPALLFGLGSIGATALLFRMAKQEMANKKLAATLKMTRVRDIKNGLCLTAGEVEADATVETPYTSTPSVWYGYWATRKRSRQGHAGLVDVQVASGSRSCPFFLKDGTGRIEIIPDGGRVTAYPHGRTLKSQSGSSTSLGDRVKKLKKIDSKNYPEGKKKSFFRKIEMEDEPLDIPDDLVELTPGSPEVKNAHQKYSENWVQPGDHVYVLGTASTGGSSSSMKITKAGKAGPLFLSMHAQDLTDKAFQTNFMVISLVGLGLGLLGIVLVLIGLGVVDV